MLMHRTCLNGLLCDAGDDEEAAENGAMASGDDDGAAFLLTDDGGDVDLRLERLEWLLARRPLLLNSVMLRQNPHNVQARPALSCALVLPRVVCNRT